MTLPTRPHYTVAERKPNNVNTNELLKHLPPYGSPSGHQHGPSVPPNQVHDIQMSSLFPFVGQEMKFVESSHSMGMPVEPPVHNVSNLTSILHDVFKPFAVDHLSMEELQTRKHLVRSHRLLLPMMEFLVACKKEGLLPPLDMLGIMEQQPIMDFGLEDFLSSQGIETTALNSDDPQKNAEREEFLFKLEQLKEKYKEELDKLNRVCNEFSTRMLNLLRDQSSMRPVSEQETSMMINGIQQKFDYVRNQLRQNVCNAILVLQKQYNQSRKKRRTLPKKATEGLSTWFFEHINDPYPSEEEKTMLASAGGLTITQVNNWFGNKRIRYKRKCLEEEAKRSRLMEGGTEPSPNGGKQNKKKANSKKAVPMDKSWLDKVPDDEEEEDEVMS